MERPFCGKIQNLSKVFPKSSDTNSVQINDVIIKMHTD